MTHARQALDRLDAFSLTLPRRAVKLPNPSFSSEAVQLLNASDSALRPPEGSALDAARVRLVKIFSEGGQPTRRDLRDAVWLLWDGREPLVGLPGLLEAIWKQAQNSNATLRGLIEVWLRSFSKDEPGLQQVGLELRRLLIAKPTVRMQRWRTADASLDFFDGRLGPGNLAAWLIDGPELPNEVLAATGFDDPLRAAGGYFREVQREIVLRAPLVLRRAGAKQLVQRLLAPLTLEGKLRFGDPEARGEMVRGLLRVWLDNGPEPEDAVRLQIQDFLLRHLEDPRLQPQRWQEAGEEATNLMRRWLTRASLKAFFALISDHALDSHWRYREAFWSACLDKDATIEAWLGLGSQIHTSARAVEDLKGAYARLDGAYGNQAILLLRIKNTIFCEWSHNGKLRAWPEEWKTAPRLGKKLYTRKELTEKGLPFPPNPRFGSNGASDGKGLSHVGSDRNLWQGSAAELLARRTQIALSPSEWMPR